MIDKKNITILIAEDEVMIAQCIQFELEDSGYNVLDFVTSGQECIDLAIASKPDLILMDIHLEGDIDGITAAHKLNDALKTKIIFMTGYDEQKISTRAMEVIPYAYLQKPVSIEDIDPIITKIFSF